MCYRGEKCRKFGCMGGTVEKHLHTSEGTLVQFLVAVPLTLQIVLSHTFSSVCAWSAGETSCCCTSSWLERLLGEGTNNRTNLLTCGAPFRQIGRKSIWEMYVYEGDMWLLPMQAVRAVSSDKHSFTRELSFHY